MLHFRYPLPARSLLDDGLQTASVYGARCWHRIAVYNKKSGISYFHGGIKMRSRNTWPLHYSGLQAGSVYHLGRRTSDSNWEPLPSVPEASSSSFLGRSDSLVSN